MDKKFFKRFYAQLKLINIWLILVIAVVSGVIFAFSMRHNNVRTLQLRDNVNQVDKDNGDVETALRQLRAYIAAHMNTNLSSGQNTIKPPIQLKYRYDRLVKAEQNRLSSENAKVYTDAQAECEKQFPKGLSGSGRIPCITDYVSSHGVPVTTIADSLYKFDFVSPTWSPDVAGWSLVITSVATALFIIRFGLEKWTKAELRDL